MKYLILILSSWLILQGYGQGYITAQQNQVTLPFHLFDGKIILPVKVDDKVTLNFAVDTGVNQPILLDRKWAKRLGWSYHRSTAFLGVGSARKITAQVTYPQVKLELPGLIGNNLTFLVLQNDPLRLGEYDIHGLIGTHLFMDLVVQIDFKHKLITFFKHHVPSPQYHTMDLRFHNLKPYVQASINGQRTEFLVDLGSDHEVLLFHRKERESGTSYQARGFGGSFSGTRSSLAQLELGGLTWRHVGMLSVRTKEYSEERAIAGRQGTLGAQLFENHLMVLDYNGQKMYLKPNNSAELDNYQTPQISAQNSNNPIVQ